MSYWIFWLSAGFISYTYVLYPLVMALAARLRPRPVARQAGYQPSISFIVSAHNEAVVIARRIENLLAQDYPADRLEVIAVSDGSTDETALILHQLERRDPRVRSIIRIGRKQGKAAALNAAVARAGGELLVFTDARQTFERRAAACLAENFADPAVGAASGELMLRGERGVAGQVGLYWTYEKWIRRGESATGSIPGATGAIYASRRELWRPLPPETILDDLLAPMRIVMGGRRAILDGRAIAWDAAPRGAAREFRRKVRTLAGNFQAIALEPGMLLPWRNPANWLQFWSHKVCRLLAPYALMLMLAASVARPGGFYLACVAAQTAFYGAALGGHLFERRGRRIRSRAISLAYTFSILNAAAVYGLWHWARGKTTEQLWRKT